MDVEPDKVEIVETKSRKRPEFEVSNRITLHKGPISCVKYSPNGCYLAVASADKTISVFQTSDYSFKFLLEGHEMGINAVSWCPTSHYLASCSDDKTIRIWSMEKGILVRVINSLSHFPTCLSINPRGTIVACSSVDNHIYFFSIFTRTLLKSIYAHSNTITSIDFNHNGTKLISSSIDGFCRVWECESGNCLHTLHPNETAIPIVSACFSPNEKYALLSFLQHGLALWCLENEIVEKIGIGYHQVEQYLCNSIFYHYIGHFMMSGCEEGKVVLYSLDKDGEVITVDCSEEVVLCVDYCLENGDIVAGTMGMKNEVVIVKRKL